MGVIVSSKQEVEAYFENPAVSQSILKPLSRGLEAFLSNQKEKEEKLFHKEHKHFTIGSAVDVLLTGEQGQFESMYHVSELEVKPTEAIASIVNEVVHMLSERAEEEEVELDTFILDNGNDLERYEQEIFNACNNHAYQPRWKDETKVNKIVTEGDEYFKDLLEAHGKAILDKTQYNNINSMEMSLRTNPLTAKYFDRDLQASAENVDFYYQMIIYFEYQEIQCKAMLDLVIVTKDEEGKPIKIEPIDLKTMSGSTLDFPKSMKVRRYDIQAAWYSLALLKHFKVQSDIIQPFKFIVESSTGAGNPLIYVSDLSLLVMGVYGRPFLLYGDKDNENVTQYKLSWEIWGYEQLISEYKWYEENGWEKDRLVVQSEGVLNLNWNSGR